MHRSLAVRLDHREAAFSQFASHVRSAFSHERRPGVEDDGMAAVAGLTLRRRVRAITTAMTIMTYDSSAITIMTYDSYGLTAVAGLLPPPTTRRPYLYRP